MRVMLEELKRNDYLRDEISVYVLSLTTVNDRVAASSGGLKRTNRVVGPGTIKVIGVEPRRSKTIRAVARGSCGSNCSSENGSRPKLDIARAKF